MKPKVFSLVLKEGWEFINLQLSRTVNFSKSISFLAVDTYKDKLPLFKLLFTKINDDFLAAS
jgi:hypothetical protein